MNKDETSDINYYKQTNPQLYYQLKTLITNFPKNYVRMLKTKKYKSLYQWIILSTPLLTQNNYTLTTKCYWILHGVIDFPLCQHCKRKLIDKNVINIRIGYSQTCSVKCSANSPNVKQKKIDTCRKRYNSDYAISAKQTRIKAEQTCLQRYGSKNVFSKNSTIFPHKFDRISKQLGRKITNISQISEISQKIRNTKMKKYGPNGFDIEKMKAKNREKYGVDFLFSYKPFRSRLKTIFLQKYGVDNPWKSHDIQKCIRKRYIYNGISFDSSPEIAYYVFLTDHKIKFTYHPNKFFEYIFNGKTCKTWPDFLVNGEYQELKGNQFFNDDGSWKCPWDRSLDSAYEAKHQALIANNVKIIRTADYIKYIKYVQQKYGTKFFANCRRSNFD